MFMSDMFLLSFDVSGVLFLYLSGTGLVFLSNCLTLFRYFLRDLFDWLLDHHEVESSGARLKGLYTGKTYLKMMLNDSDIKKRSTL